MVVLDAIHSIQAHQAPDLAVRWNCKAAKCGSCSAEVNGRPRLMCKTRMDSLPLDQARTVYPMKAFPVIKDLVTDVSWNYKVNKKIPPFQPRPGVEWKMYQRTWTACRNSASASSASCARTSATFCATTIRRSSSAARASSFAPRGWKCIRSMALDRTRMLKEELGIGFCNITKCCTEVCPEEIHITDNAIIPLKERVVDEFYDPVTMIVRKIFGAKKS